jgi:hypothetical protein
MTDLELIIKLLYSKAAFFLEPAYINTTNVKGDDEEKQ